MSIKAELRGTIDRLVEDAIRRILPSVMNEVLMRTLLSSGGVLGEAQERPRRRKKVQRPKPQPRNKVKVRKNEALARRGQNLRDLLDESAGAEFYGNQRGDEQADDEETSQEVARPVTSRLSSLPPELRSLAKDVSLPDDDGGETWDGVGDSVGQPTGRSVGDLASAAKGVGIDFSRMLGTIRSAGGPPKVSADDARVNEQFEARRIKSMRESLNGGKPVE